MHDDYRSRSPDRGRHEDPRYYRGRDPATQKEDDYYRSRQDYSRSPVRYDSRSNRYQDTMGRDSRPGDNARRYDDDDGPSRLQKWENHDYSGMYDDDYRHDDDRDHGRTDTRPYDDRRHYRDRDDPGFRSPRHSRGRSRSPSSMREAGKPTDTVILEGLPFSITTRQLQESLLSRSIAGQYPSIDVRISSSKGNRRAFVQFASTDHSAAFIREHFPKLYLDIPHSTDSPDSQSSVFIHYARNRDDTDGHTVMGGVWNCPSCDFQNYATRLTCKHCETPQSASNWQQNMTGDTDTGAEPSQILVVYPIPSFVTEDVFAAEMKRLELEPRNLPPKETDGGGPKLKSTAPVGGLAPGCGARPGSLHRVFVMRDATTHESFKYGFAEFWTPQDAMEALTRFKKSPSFTVSACAVNVSYIHMGVFLPEDRPISPNIERMSFYPLFNTTLRVRYRDIRLYPSQKVLTTEPPAPEEEDGDESAEKAIAQRKKPKKRKAEGLPEVPAAKPGRHMAGQMAMWQQKHEELHASSKGASSEAAPSLSDANNVPVSSSPSGLSRKNFQKPGAKGTIKISLTGSSLGGATTSDAQPNAFERLDQPNSPGKGDTDIERVLDEGLAPESKPVSYVDRARLMCLICMRKYKSVEEVDIHERSRNHKTAMENEDQVKAALPRLAIRDKRLQMLAEENSESAAPQYRDRAKERREANKQPSRPTSQQASGNKRTLVTEAVPAPTKPQPSKGAGMLAKMGWTSGAGLGANGDGRTDVIATNAYQEGVGLGAEGSNLGDAARIAERKTRNSYADYLETVQDKARERFNKLG